MSGGLNESVGGALWRLRQLQILFSHHCSVESKKFQNELSQVELKPTTLDRVHMYMILHTCTYKLIIWSMNIITYLLMVSVETESKAGLIITLFNVISSYIFRCIYTFARS